ncbi:MAG: CHAT domain-containing protein [Scytonema sp. RU_4_4]|nr:CHAT domain-containing protein [Scytonema sp. RU_4_4]
MRRSQNKYEYFFVLGVLSSIAVSVPSNAQSILPASDGTGTIVTPNGNRLDIGGGQLSRDGANLFHSFIQLNLSQGEIANFLSNPKIQNILGRVTGGDVSIINGLLQISGGNSNLFLMNPAGIVFGTNASLNLPGSFTATTSNGIGFGSNWFHATGLNDYSSLVGNPGTFAFTMSQPGGIINAGNLSVTQGQNLTLIGGTVISTGQLSAPQGQIMVSAVPGGNWVRISPPGQVVSLEIRPPSATESQPNTWTIPIASLPELLTGKGGQYVSGVSVNNNGQVNLAGSNLPVEAGDVTAKQVTTQTATLSANRNLTLVESQLNTTGDLNLLAGNTVQMRDSITNPFTAHSQGNLYIQGNQSIDILALNHPETPFQSGGNLSLVSDGVVSGDSHFASKGNFSILNLSGQPGNFVSLYDPIISSNGDVSFGDYTGVALKVEALGSISAGNITITGPDTSLTGSDPDISTLTSSRSLILRAGLNTLENPANMPQSQQGTSFTSPGGPSSPASITAKDIRTSASSQEDVEGGSVILNAPGDIRADSINSSSSRRNGGTISINSSSGIIDTGSIDSSSGTGNGGTVTVSSSSGSINTGSINTSSGTENGGTVNFSSNSGTIDTGSINTSSGTGNAGIISISGRVNTNSTNTTVISTVSQSSTNQSTKNSSSNIPSNIPSDNLPEQSRKPEITAESIEITRQKEFEDFLGNGFPEKFTDAKDIRYALHAVENQFQEINNQQNKNHKETPKIAVIYTVKKRDYLQIVLETSQGEFVTDVPDAKFEQLKCRSELLRQLLSKKKIETELDCRKVLGAEYNADDHSVHAKKLYHWLMKDIEKVLDRQGINTLLFSMEKELRLIPLAALQKNKEEFLIDKYAISLIPSLSYTDITYTSPTKYKVLAMGASDFSKSSQSSTLAAGTEESRQLSTLAAVPAELAIFNNKDFWEAEGSVIKDSEFDMDNLNNESKKRPFRIVHLATHAGFQQDDNQKQKQKAEFYIQFEDSRKTLQNLQDKLNPPKENFPKELRWSDFRVDLLVLSACDTQQGIAGSEKIFVGLSAKLGVKSTLASLWEVSDPGSLILMSEFIGI